MEFDDCFQFTIEPLSLSLFSLFLVDSMTEFSAPQRVCHGCKLSIEDEFSLHVSPNLDWHVSCLVCCECHEFMDENCETCFIKDGKPYCRSDYIK